MLLSWGHTKKKDHTDDNFFMMKRSRRHDSELRFKNNTPCQLAYLCRRFGRVHCVHIQSQAVQFLDSLTTTMIFLGAEHGCACP
jgi:hypothetical protein